ncbi:MAG: YigZ family protein [Gammaproteobacteria bacterium]|nr:YigZ family protein [Gammaproteobacteria bacterium]MBU1554633.1 YigZ family protein [Gammaproteobacteria bacterium]MBU2071532.1 YigZ family protein [Gammaproteobacteria bacterium]MBU2184023.1 YigZ family protein [Gammaproteobacteria bacterium]MBU2206891.1 YigZ family protein [Gammaproteobacteria bacterium]
MTRFTVLAAATEHLLLEKNSEFLTFLHPVDNRDAAMTWVAHYRTRYPDANHVCWAYIIGNTRQPQTQAFSDDGEPGGTAGKPMLHVLTERELGNCLAVVVRYFGGVKLGAGGLVRAYSNAVSQAASNAELRVVSPSVQLSIIVSFAFEARLRQLLQQYNASLDNVSYSDQVTLSISLPQDVELTLRQQLINETAGTIVIKP